jgi:hypothetical protein
MDDQCQSERSGLYRVVFKDNKSIPGETGKRYLLAGVEDLAVDR